MIEGPETPHAHGHGGGGWFDRALAVGVIALSAVSVYVALHTGETMEALVDANSKLVRANSTPLLQFETGNVNDADQREISFTVSNVGTGTARVLWFEIAKAGTARRNIRALIEYEPKASERDYIRTRGVANSYMPAGESRQIVGWRLPDSPISLAKWQALDVDRRSLKVAACFCSVLGDCWISNLRADTPRPVAACDVRGRVNFEG